MTVPDREDFLRTLHAARAGDDAALTRLFQLLYPAVLRYLRVIEPTEAEDLASETWLDVVHALRGFEGDERGLRALALTIARRRVVDLRRRRARQGIIPTEPEHLAALGAVGDAEEEAVSRLELDEAIERLRALPPDQAEVILLRVLGGLGVEEVASIMGKRRGTVRVLQHRGLRALARTAAEHAIWSNGVTR